MGAERFGRFRCGTEVRAGDVLGPVVVDVVNGAPDRFSVTFTYPGPGFGGSVCAAHVYTREQFIANRIDGTVPPSETDEWWD